MENFDANLIKENFSKTQLTITPNYDINKNMNKDVVN